MIGAITAVAIAMFITGFILVGRKEDEQQKQH
jgi:hypothetical protein